MRKDDFIEWMLNLFDGDISKRTAFNSIIKYYSQEGINFCIEHCPYDDECITAEPIRYQKIQAAGKSVPQKIKKKA